MAEGLAGPGPLLLARPESRFEGALIPEKVGDSLPGSSFPEACGESVRAVPPLPPTPGIKGAEIRVKSMCYNCYTMAESIPHRELRNNSSAILEQVRNGETFEITNRGEPVAILSPPDRAAIERLRVRPATKSGSFAEIEGVVIEGRSGETLRDLRGER